MHRKKTIEPLWWGLFSAGGVLAALLVPVHILLTGLAVPLGWTADASAVFGFWLIRLYLFVLIALPLYHAAHRILFTLSDIGLKRLRPLLAVLCYGGALLGTLVTIWILLRL